MLRMSPSSWEFPSGEGGEPLSLENPCSVFRGGTLCDSSQHLRKTSEFHRLLYVLGDNPKEPRLHINHKQ